MKKLNSRIKRRERYRLSRLKWEDAYQLPLHMDKYGGYAWSENGTMSLKFEFEENDRWYERAERLVECINGETESDSKGRWHKDVDDFFLDGEYMFRVRGWGHLTGTGAMHLPVEYAKRIQDGFIDYIFRRLNGE